MRVTEQACPPEAAIELRAGSNRGCRCLPLLRRKAAQATLGRSPRLTIAREWRIVRYSATSNIDSVPNSNQGEKLQRRFSQSSA
jgi:hypothetical protein